jgi:hypothetical protein
MPRGVRLTDGVELELAELVGASARVLCCFSAITLFNQIKV